ncbi:family 16 glycoside hydrolase [Tardiphaga sp.]|uniref:family 16 glycoside hydrolase n=1 Tax=Tardiphaga sp. TaxID=1926292 RepID=UPI0026293F57|nr:family 16 glycoside hydrolase [Tardiphaga sp.]MDB5618327.1 hypothetical protein [Tardiphaga sp.]
MKKRSILAAAAIAYIFSAQPGAYAQDGQTAAEISAASAVIPLADFDLGKALDGERRQWNVVPDRTVSCGAAIEHSRAVSTDERGSLAIYRSALLKDADINLRFKAVAGKSDQGGGIALRMASPTSYYVVQIDALRDRARLVLVKNGVFEEIAGIDADVTIDQWHTLAVRAQDERFTVYLDGVWLFTGYDKTLSRAGRIGLWAKSDSVTRFDHVTIAPIPPPELWK